MTRLALFLSLAAGLAASPAAAASFTFADATGAPLCNSIRLTQDHGAAAGIIDGSACTPAANLIGSGVQTSMLGHAGKLWSFSTGVGKYTSLFLLDERNLTWSLSAAGRGDGLRLHQVASGLLLRGGQAARPGARSVLPQ